MYDAEKFIQILESYRPKMCSDDLVTYILSCYLLVCSGFLYAVEFNIDHLHI